MLTWRMRRVPALIVALVVPTLGCNDGAAPGGEAHGTPMLKGGKPVPSTGVNNLSFPVLWSDGVPKALPGTVGMDPVLNGEYWYQWGTYGFEEDQSPASCRADPDEGDPLLNPEGLYLCDDGESGTVNLDLTPGFPPADNPQDLAKVFLQKDGTNVWQAYSAHANASRFEVDLLDWGDNLESVDWYTRSQVRTEVVLFQDNPDPVNDPWLEYEMRHTSGWGIDEVHGLAADPMTVAPVLGPGNQATVYTHCARLTIQKLFVSRDDPALDPALGNLEWVPTQGWMDSEGSGLDLVNESPVFNLPVHEGGDGPGYYSAEINVKGRIIFGYTWSVRKLNEATVNGGEAAGDYRITFSLDQECGTATLNTFFSAVDGTPVTQILLPVEEVVVASEEGDGGSTGGAVGVMDYANNLTYMDVRILERTGGK